MTLERRDVLDEMPEANYLVGHPDGPYYRLIVRCLYERHRAHANYLRTDEITAYVQRYYAEYDEAACRRHLDQLERWRLVRALPEQSRPQNLLELRQRPRTYQAERLTLMLEELRVREEEAGGAASLNPTALDQLVGRLEELTRWLTDGGLDEDDQHTYELWYAVWRAFDGFARDVEAYLADLPRHKPRETLDYLGFLGYRDVITRYLSDYARRLFERKEYVRYLLRSLQPLEDQLAGVLAAVGSRQVRADGTAPELAAEQKRYRADLAALHTYFAPQGDAEVLLDLAQRWVADITRHARRLSEQHRGGTVREQTLLELGRRFARIEEPEQAQALAQVAFGATLPLHWKGPAPPSQAKGGWESPSVTVPLLAVRRGPRQRLPADSTLDRTGEQLERMLAESRERARIARELAALFGPDGTLNLADLEVPEPRLRQQLLRLFYQALSRGGTASMGCHNWRVTVEETGNPDLGELRAPDGVLRLPGCVLRLHAGRSGHG